MRLVRRSLSHPRFPQGAALTIFSISAARKLTVAPTVTLRVHPMMVSSIMFCVICLSFVKKNNCLHICLTYSCHIGYDTACSPDISQEIQKKSCSTRGRKRKREDDNEAREKKKIKKNGSQRNRKREERYYMEALKRIFIHYDFIAAKTPKRAITHVSRDLWDVSFIQKWCNFYLQFETLKIARTKINGFIDDGVPDGQIKQICDRVLQKS